jgi:FkbM family methyltransferase
MSLKASLARFAHRHGYSKLRLGRLNETWIDVGAHGGETTFESALRNKGLTVFAFEPNWALARQLMGRLENFIVIPMAVSTEDGTAEFMLNATDGSSSLLEMREEGKQVWSDYDLSVTAKVTVPTIRLDTFMNRAQIPVVDYLKVDAEGADLMVIESCGDRLKDVRRIQAEVDLADPPLYEGAPTKAEFVDFMKQRGFALTRALKQNQDRQENLVFTQAARA